MDKSLPLVEAAFGWARQIEPRQPLTMGVWNEGLRDLNEAMISRSDIVTYHTYTNYEGQRQAIARYCSCRRSAVGPRLRV